MLQNTHSKSILAVILRCQPTLYDRRFARYGKSCNIVITRSQKQKMYFQGTFGCRRGIHSIEHPQLIKPCGHFERSTNFLRPTVRKIWILSNFGAFDPNFGGKKQVSPTYQSDHQVNPENRPSRDSKTAAFLEFTKIDYHPPSSIGLYQKLSSSVEFQNFYQKLCLEQS